MGSAFFTWYRRLMILCLGGGAIDVVGLGLAYVTGRPATHGFFVALWCGFLAIMISIPSLVKMRSLARLMESPK